MSEVLYVKPQIGLTVRHPKNKTPVPLEGMLIELSGSEGNYWRRRINDGSLIVVVSEDHHETITIDKKKGGNK